MESFAEHYGSMYQTVNRCLPGIDMTMIDKAVEYAREKHKDQKRKDGSPYIIHPLAVAEIVAEMGLDMARVHKNLHIRLTPGSQKADLTTSQTMQRLLQAKES